MLQQAFTKETQKPLRKGLKSKLILSMVGVGTLPLLLAMGISYLQGTKSLQNVIGASFQALAFETAAKIDFIMKEEIKKNTRLASHPTLILTVRERYRLTSRMTPAELRKQFHNQAELWETKDPNQKSLLDNSGSRILKSFLKRDPLSKESTHALFVTDAKGILLSSATHYPEFLMVLSRLCPKPSKGGRDLFTLAQSDLYQERINLDFTLRSLSSIKTEKSLAYCTGCIWQNNFLHLL